jgi:hypothetical protein
MKEGEGWGWGGGDKRMNGESKKEEMKEVKKGDRQYWQRIIKVKRILKKLTKWRFDQEESSAWWKRFQRCMERESTAAERRSLPGVSP